jgi:hypothetical protein
MQTTEFVIGNRDSLGLCGLGNRVLFPTSFQKHNGFLKFSRLEDHFFNRVQYSTKTLGLVNSTTKILSSL